MEIRYDGQHGVINRMDGFSCEALLAFFLLLVAQLAERRTVDGVAAENP